VFPVFESYDDNFIPFNKLVELELPQSRRSLIFKNFLLAIRNFHDLGYSHLALTPQNIWIEDMFYVYLGPCYIGERKHTVFDDTQGRLFNTCLTFFAPEIIFSPKSEDDEYFMDISLGYDSKSDLWSLGMIYMYLFHASVEGKEANELFKASNLETFIFHEFTTLGFPALSEVPYMDKMEYNRLKKKTQGYLRQKANPEASEFL
jgi:serine/threonine protein kinase